MVSPFALRGYRGLDPLDYVPERTRSLIPIIVTAVIATALVVVIAPVLRVVEFAGVWMMIVEVVVFAFITAPLVTSLRKSSTLVLVLLTFVPLFLLELYLQAHVRGTGVTPLWDFPEGTFITAITNLPLRFVVTSIIDAVLMGPVALWISRLIALAMHDREAARRDRENASMAKSPFDAAWTDEPVTKPARPAQFWVLRILGLAYLTYLLVLVVGAVGSSPWPDQLRNLFDMTYANPFFGVSTFSKIGFMVVLAFTAAYNARIRWYATLLLCIGHAISVVSSVAFWLVGGQPAAQHEFLIVSAIVDVVMVIAFIWILVTSRAEREEFPEDQTFPSTFSLPARLSRTVFTIVGVIALAMIVTILLVRFLVDRTSALGAMLGAPDPTLCNALTMHSVIAMLALMLARRDRLRDYLMPTLLFGLFLTIVTGIVWMLLAPVVVRLPDGIIVEVHPFFLARVVGITVVYGVLIGLRKMLYDVDYAISTFNPSSARNVMAMHGAIFVDAPERPADVLQSIDRYAGTIRGRKRGLLNFPFWLVENFFNVMFGARPPFSTMSAPERRYFLRNYLIRTTAERRRALMPEIADGARGLAVAAHAVVLFATYSQLRRHARIGYVAPGARDRLQTECPTGEPPFEKIAALPVDENDPRNYRPPSSEPYRAPAPRLSTPVTEPDAPRDADFVVVGSGPGGAVMAYRIAQACPGASILVVERGGRYSPLQDFNDREIEMMPKLYKEGGLQQTKRADMFVLQGECVGGGSVINNAVCYEMPQEVRDEWSAEYGIGLGGLAAEYSRIAGELGIVKLPPASINMRTGERFLKGVAGYEQWAKTKLDVIPSATVNAAGTMGDGLWNIGNRYLRKRSMLETYLPWAEARGMTPAGDAPFDSRVRILSNTTAVQFTGDRGSARSIVLRSATGALQTVRVNKGIVVAGGVISSSHFLMRSGVAGNVGRRMSCNFAFPLAFVVDEEIRGFDGEQITMGATVAGQRMIFETYFNPPSALALSVPFYLDRHDRVMSSYSRLLNFGVLVGSEPRGTIERTADLLNGQAFTWSLGPDDERNIKYALETLLRIGMHGGATRAILPMQPGVDLDLSSNPEGVVDEFVACLTPYHLSMGDMLMSTAHPQGGNLMAADGSPSARHSVVDGTFRVRGYDNVFVADASLFPTGVTINPQWTIMAMSSLASHEVTQLW